MIHLNKEISLGIPGADTFVHKCDHIAYFWENETQFKNAVGFLELGIRNHEHCVVFGFDEANDKVLSILRDLGLDTGRLISDKQLSVLNADGTGEATLQRIGATFQKALNGGAPMIRLLGNIGWHRPNWPDESEILAFEAKVTDAARAFPCVVVCMYDVNALPGKVIIRGGLETHPVTIRGNVVRENPFYVTIQEFLEQLEKDKAA
ncbi:MAG: signal transduction histidine kinase [Acidobacteriales bacterium]|nr:signal transduction histidine kinase [Terriglobales bacterium]